MHFVRCIGAEWLIVRARLLRTRLGLWLVLLVAAFAWAAPPGVLTVVAARTGLLAGLLCVAFAAGTRLDRLAFATTLAHPTTPLAIASGRWLGATIAAALAVTAVTIAAAWRDGAGAAALISGWMHGIVVAGGAAGAALPLVLLGGNVCAAVLIAAAFLLDPFALAGPAFLYLSLGCASGGIPAAAALLARAR